MAEANCPHCGGTGWKTIERDARGLPDRQAGAPPGSGARGKRGAGSPHDVVAAPCDCVLGNRMSRALARARIPRRYEHCDFENFDTDHYGDDPQARLWNSSLEQAKLVVEAFARDCPTTADCGLLLMGPCGAGKTHLAVAALKDLIRRGHEGLFYDYRELLKEIQASYNPVSQATEMGVLEPVLTVELLLLDDLGASKPSAWTLDTVGHILNTRYNERRITLLTTNYLDSPAASPEPARLPSGQVIPNAREEGFGERVGQRIRSRLYEMCRTVEIMAPDYRKEVRQVGRVRS